MNRPPFQRLLRNGVECYLARPNEFARVIGFDAPAATRARVARIALNGERRRGLDCHWTFSINRLIALRICYLAERLIALRSRAAQHRRAA